MKNTLLTALGIAGVLVVAGSFTTVSAGCNPTKDFKLAYSDAGDYFLIFPPNTNKSIGGGVLKTRFWQAGDRAAVNETGCPSETYMFEYDPDHITFFGQSGGDVLNTGPCDNVGCPTGTMIMLIQTLSNDNSKAYYAIGKVNETVGEFQFNRGGTDWLVTEIPRPRVLGSSSNGSLITINVCLDPPTGAHGEADGFARNSIVTGYQLVAYEGGSEPGRDPAAWTNYGSVLPVNESVCTPASIEGPCYTSGANDFYFAMRPVFDDGQFLGDYVGASTRVECQSVADPRFNGVDRRKSGRDAIRSNPRPR